MSDWYILDENNNAIPATVHEWEAWYRRCPERKHVAVTMIGDARVSTVFLGLDHSWGGAPLLFETMVFGGPMDQEQDRCMTYEGAKSMHEKMCGRVRELAKEANP